MNATEYIYKNVEGSKLKSGEIVSCGYYGNERRIERALKTPLYGDR